MAARAGGWNCRPCHRHGLPAGDEAGACVEATTAIRQAESPSRKASDRTLDGALRSLSSRLLGDSAYGSVEMLGRLVYEHGIKPHVTVRAGGCFVPRGQSDGGAREGKVGNAVNSGAPDLGAEPTVTFRLSGMSVAEYFLPLRPAACDGGQCTATAGRPEDRRRGNGRQRLAGLRGRFQIPRHGRLR